MENTQRVHLILNNVMYIVNDFFNHATVLPHFRGKVFINNHVS